MTHELKIAELLCTRLCHDLTGPIGAVNNGAEFLAEEGFDLQNQAVELITSSAFSAVTRLQFYRTAYGYVKESGEASLSDNKKLATDFFIGSKTTLNWPDQYTDASDVSLSLRMVRLLMNLIIIASGALLKGGSIEIKIAQESSAPGEETKTMEVTAKGDALKWDPEMQAILSGEGKGSITPKNVQLYLTRRLAEELGVTLAFETSAQALHCTAVQHIRDMQAQAV